MKLKHKVWLLTLGIVALIVATDALLGYRNIEASIQEELRRDAKEIRAMLMATRRVYHQQFIASGLPLNDKTLGFLPAHALTRISKDFPNWSKSGLSFNNVSDQPRNPVNRADPFELEAMAWFRANPKAEERLVEIRDDGKSIYHYTAPIWIEEYCLKCHGERSAAPASVAQSYDAAYGYQVGDLRGVMSIKLPTEALRSQQLAEWSERFAVRLGGYVVLLLMLGIFLNRAVITRLARLQHTAGQLATGDYTARTPESDRDEIGALANAFNRMSEEVQHRSDALRDSEERFRLASEHMRDAFILIEGADGIVTWWNKAAAAIFGYAKEDVLGKPIHDLIVPPRHRQAMAAGLKDFAQNGSGHFIGKTTEAMARHQDGHEFQIELSLSAVNIQGRWVAIGVARDITDRVAAQTELERHRRHLEDLVTERTRELSLAKEAAESANVAKSAFISNMSHEIRTPLHAITGMAHLIRRSGVTPQQERWLGKIDTAEEHLLEIINAILDLSKIEAGKFVLDEAPISIDTIAGNVAAMVADRAQAKGLTLDVDIAPLPFHVKGDATRLAQALLNYVSNAIKFTETGRITLRTVLVEETHECALLRFEVTDTGIGIDADIVPKLFSVFEQADNSITRNYGGTGLGLSITKKLAELMDGTAGVVSTSGSGSTFWFTARLRKLVASAPAAPSPADAAAVLRRDYPTMRVLLVDDDADNREITQSILKEVWTSLDLAADGVEAVERARANTYDLILMDMQMPRMDGLEATRRIRALPNGTAVTILAMTANVFPEHRAQCLAAGMNGLVPKALDPAMQFAAILKGLAAARGPG